MSDYRGLADFDGPPEGIEDVSPGQIIEYRDAGEYLGRVQVISTWDRFDATRCLQLAGTEESGDRPSRTDE